MTWKTFFDKELLYEKKAIEFLKVEFGDQMNVDCWIDNYFSWKLQAETQKPGYLHLGMIESKIVSTVSFSPKRILFNGIEYFGGELGDSYCSNQFLKMLRKIKPEQEMYTTNSYLNQSIFGRSAYEITQLALKEGSQFIYGTPNDTALPGWIKRLGYIKLESHEIYLFIRPTISFFVSKKFNNSIINSLASHLDRLTVILKLRLGYFGIRRQEYSFLNKIPTQIQLDKLWEKTRPQKGFTFIREYNYWYHRYLSHPSSRYKIISIMHGETFCGILVYYLKRIGINACNIYFLEWMLDNSISINAMFNKVILTEMQNSRIYKAFTYLNCQSNYYKSFRNSLFLKRKKVTIILYPTDISNSINQLSPKDFEFYLGSSDAY